MNLIEITERFPTQEVCIDLWNAYVGEERLCVRIVRVKT